MWTGLISDGLYWKQQRQEQSRRFHQTENVNGLLQAVQHWFIMKYFFQTIFYAYVVAAFDKSSVNPTRGNEMQKAVHCNVNNNDHSFYAGPNCKNIEQLLVKLKN